MKILLATPAFNGVVTVKYMESMVRTLFWASQNKIVVEVHVRPSGSLLIAERNAILDLFRKSDCTHLLCIDSDMEWLPNAVETLINAPYELSGLSYISKDSTYIIRIPEKIHLEEDMFCEVHALPMGFVLIAKSALQKMIDHFPELYYKGKKDEGYGLFNTMVWDKQFWGEDFSFFLRAKDAGVKTYCQPFVEITHAGKKGCLIHSLKDQKFLDEKSEKLYDSIFAGKK